MCSAGTSRSSGRAAITALDVEAVAARADQHEERVEPGGADDRPVPVADPHAAVGVDQDVVVADVGVHDGVAGGHLGEARRPAPPPPRGGAGPAGWPATWSQKPTSGANSSAKVSSSRPVRRGRQPAATVSARPGRRRGRRPPGPAGVAALDVARCRARPSRRRGATAAAAPARPRAGPPACAPPRGRSRRRSAAP